MSNKKTPGTPVVYVDASGKEHNALVKIWWDNLPVYISPTGEPGCNLVFVTDGPERDCYGPLTVDRTSVLHKSHPKSAGGFWRWPSEA